MNMAILDKIPDIKAMGLPIGDAAKGMVAAGAADVLSMVANRFIPYTPVTPTADLWSPSFSWPLPPKRSPEGPSVPVFSPSDF